jgi:osmotically-inducible protein OsmY
MTMGARDFLIGAAVGAGAAYFFDPDNGTRRRHVARDRGFAAGRDVARETERKARYAEGVAEGVVAKATPTEGRNADELNDPALARKVESEIFRPAEAPKGEVNVNVEDHIVYLRGHVEDSTRAEELATAASRVEGVRDVENLIRVG